MKNVTNTMNNMIKITQRYRLICLILVFAFLCTCVFGAKNIKGPEKVEKTTISMDEWISWAHLIGANNVSTPTYSEVQPLAEYYVLTVSQRMLAPSYNELPLIKRVRNNGIILK